MSRSVHRRNSITVRTTEPSRRSSSEAGDTLIEVLLALVVLGMASVALLIAFSTSIAASAEHRKLATYNTVLATASQELTAAIQNQPTLFQDACAAGTLSSYPGYGTSISLPAPYNTSQYTVQYASVNPVQYWNGSVFQPTCYANAPQLITIDIGGYSNSFVVDYSVGSAASTASTGTADRLVFLNNIVGGYAGSPFTTQPIVAVETSTGVIVTTDLSPVILTLTSGSGTLSGCSGHEILGVVTFTGCTIGSGGTNFQITASDGIPTTLTTGISNVFSVSSSSFHLVFTTQPVAGTSGSAFVTAPVVSVENASNSINTSWSGTISVTLSGGVLSNCPAGIATSATSATLLVTNGAATLPASCTFSGGFFYNSNSSPPTTATQYTMSATAIPTASTDSAVPSQSQTLAVTGPGAAAQLKFTTEPTGVASTNASDAFTVQPAVTVEDSFGNVVFAANNSVCVQLFLGSTAQSSSVCSTSGTNGVYTFSGIHGSAWGSGYYLTATSSGLKSDQSSNFDITNVAANLAFTVSPVAGASGTVFNVQPVLVVTDTAGRVVTAATASIDNFTVSPAGGVLANCTGLAPTLGYYYLGNCTFAGIVGTNYTLTVSAGGLTSSPSAGFMPSGPGVATQLVFTVEPVAGASESVLSTQPVVKIEDSAGNVVTYSTATIGLTSSGGTLSSCTGLTAAAGVVNLSNCTFAGVVGTHYHLIATWGLITATSTDIWPTGPGAPSQLVLSGCSVNIVSLTTCAATATIEDAYANVETSDNSSVVTFSQLSGSGTVSGLGAITVTGGVASATVTGGNIGPVTIGATADSFNSNALTFSVNPIPQIITWTVPGSQTWVVGGAGTFSLGTATDTSGSAVTFASSTTSACTVNGSTVTMLTAGTCTITPTATAQGNYALTVGASSSIVINQLPQTVAFYTDGTFTTATSSGSTTYSPSGPYQLFAQGSGGGVISFTSTSSSVCTVNSSTGLITIVKAGTCTVTADAGATINYLDSGTTAFTLTINKAYQNLFAITSTSGTYNGSAYSMTLTTSGGSGTGAVTYVAVNGTASNCSVAGSTLTATTSGTCIVTATKAADVDYFAASAGPTTVTFSKATQTVAFYTGSSFATTTTSGSVNFNSSSSYQAYAQGSGVGVVSFASTSSSVCTVNSSTGLITILTVGTCTVTADAAATTNYLDSGTTTFTLSITRAHPYYISSSTVAPYKSATTIPLPRPSGVTAGDLLIAVLYTGDYRNGNYGDPTQVNLPSGWTLLSNATSPGPQSNGAILTAYHVATASEPSSYSFSSANFDRASAVMMDYRNTDNSTPLIDQSNWNPTQTSSVLTPSTSSDALITVYGDFNANTLSVVGLSVTQRAFVSNYSSVLLADQNLTSAASVPAIPVNGGSGHGASVTILLKY